MVSWGISYMKRKYQIWFCQCILCKRINKRVFSGFPYSFAIIVFVVRTTLFEFTPFVCLFVCLFVASCFLNKEYTWWELGRNEIEWEQNPLLPQITMSKQINLQGSQNYSCFILHMQVKTALLFPIFHVCKGHTMKIALAWLGGCINKVPLRVVVVCLISPLVSSSILGNNGINIQQDPLDKFVK